MLSRKDLILAELLHKNQVKTLGSGVVLRLNDGICLRYCLFDNMPKNMLPVYSLENNLPDGVLFMGGNFDNLYKFLYDDMDIFQKYGSVFLDELRNLKTKSEILAKLNTATNILN